ncbi:MAG: SpoIIE family protein phosphatase [Candidatus Schekmanbacteria bacterium]|nr:SpoIIE family protein phosphatase [Candidatus Schekmanbacteria bacterium]
MLRKIPFLTDLSDKQLSEVAPYFTERSYAAGEFIIREGQVGDELFVVKSGSVKVSKNTVDGTEQIASVGKPGTFYGEMALLEDRPRSANVIALEDTETMVLSRVNFKELLVRFPDINLGMLRALSNRIREADAGFIRDLQERNRRLRRAFKELRRAQEQLREQARIQEELRIGRRIQMSLLPRQDPNLERFEIRALCRPAHEVGGDFYSYISDHNGHLGIAIGDVSGKSVPGAMLMAVASSVISSIAIGKNNPAQVLLESNVALYDKMQGNRSFVALGYACVNDDSNEVLLANAGQMQPVLCRSDGSYCDFVDVQGLPLGVMDLRQNGYQYGVQSVALNKNDLLVFTTDGLVEAMNSTREMFGLERLQETVRNCARLPADEVVAALIADVEAFLAGIPPHDDQTIVVLRAL